MILNGIKYDLIEEGFGEKLGNPIGGANVIKELSLSSKFSDAGKYKITFELQDLNNSNLIIASETFDITVKEEKMILNQTNETDATLNINYTENSIQNEQNILNNVVNKESNISNTSGEIVYKPATLPKAGSTIYFLILPIGGILILIYCIFKKKDEEL